MDDPAAATIAPEKRLPMVRTLVGINLSDLAISHLKRAGIESLEALIASSRMELLRSGWVTARDANEIAEKLKPHGLALAADKSQGQPPPQAGVMVYPPLPSELEAMGYLHEERERLVRQRNELDAAIAAIRDRVTPVVAEARRRIGKAVGWNYSLLQWVEREERREGAEGGK